MIGSEYVRKCDGTYKTVTGRKELQKLFTFWPQVSNAHIERTDEGDQVHFDLQLSTSTAKTVLSNQTERSLRKLAWDTVPVAFRLCPPIRVHRECFLELVQQQLSLMELPVTYVPSRNGWNHANGAYYFLFGNQLILPPVLEGQVSPPQKIALRVTLAQELTEQQIAGWFTHVLCSVPHLSLPLCLANILGLLYSRLQALGRIPEGWLWVVGRSSAGKTSLVQTLCCLYNRDSGLKSCTIPAGSTVAYASSRIQQLQDTVCVIDDKAITEGTTLSGRQTTLIDSLIRSSTNNTTRGVFGRDEKPACCYFVGTAEAGFQAESVANRGIVLEIGAERIDFSALNDCLDDSHHRLEAFWFNFTRWLVMNQSLDAWLQTRTQQAVHPDGSHQLESPRVASHIAFFHMAGDLLCDYFDSLKLWEEEIAAEWRSNVHEQLNQLYNRQLVLLSRLREQNDPNQFARAIADLVHSGTLRIVQSTHLAFPSQCDAFKYASGRGEVFICFHTDVLIGALGERGLHATYKELRQTLVPPGILIPDCDGKVTRNIGGTRGVQISWTRLVEVLSHQ